MVEEWRPVTGYGGRYEVSNLGRVRSHFGRKYWRKEPKVLKPAVTGYGYQRVILCLDGEQNTHTVHSLVAETFLGPRPEGQQVRHPDGNPGNCRLGNLQYGTPEENSADRKLHGTHHQGETVNGAYLTEWHVREIRRLRADGWKQLAIANLFDLPRTTVNAIANGYTWKHVGGFA